MMGEAPKLQWVAEKTNGGNTVWRAGGWSIRPWKVYPFLADDRVKYRSAPECHPDLDWEAPFLAQSWCQEQEDIAWRAAHPEPEPVAAVREFTDTEILDAMTKYRIDVEEMPPFGPGSQWMATINRHEDRPGGCFYGPTPREAVAAFLRSLPPEQPEQPEPAATEAMEAAGDEGMTVAELDDLAQQHEITVKRIPNRKPQERWNAHEFGDFGGVTDVNGPTY